MVDKLFILLGGAGYFGYNFAKTLNGICIIVDREIYENDKKFIYVKHDLTKDFDSLFKKLSTHIQLATVTNKVDLIVVNFAAESFVDDSLKKPEYVMENNINCCLTFCKFVNKIKYLSTTYLKNRIRSIESVHISTDEVFNKFQKQNVFKSSYSVSKDVCEIIVENITPKTFIIRPSNIFGVVDYEDKNTIQKKSCVINNLVNGVYIVHNSDVSRRFVHIKDLCFNLLDLIELGSVIPTGELLENIKLKKIPDTNIYYFNDDDEIKIYDLVKYVSEKDDYEFIKTEIDPRGFKQDEHYNSFSYYDYNANEIKTVVKENSHIPKNCSEHEKNSAMKNILGKIYSEILKIRQMDLNNCSLL